MLQNSSTPQASWLTFAAIATVCVAAPFMFVQFPPSTDLPQHMAQIYLLEQVLSGHGEGLAVNWFSPLTLVYSLLGAAWYLTSPVLAGKVTLLVLALAWVWAAFYLAWMRQRSPVPALFASILVFNHALYWGLLNFVTGWPIFALWFIQSLKPHSNRSLLILFVLSVFLFWSHAFWFLAGSLWLGAYTLWRWPGMRVSMLRFAILLPVGIAGLIWFPELAAQRAASGVDVGAHWYTLPFERFAPAYFINSVLGGLSGGIEGIVVLALTGWIALSAGTNWANLKDRVDQPLLLCAGLFAFVMLLAPDKYVNTLFVGTRWFPMATLMLLLALPLPTRLHRFAITAALVLAMVYSAATSRAWYQFEHKEMSGMTAALAQVQPGTRVLGLDYAKFSDGIKGRPFLQMAAYAQAWRGAELNFSFAQHFSGVVSYIDPSKHTTAKGFTEWSAERVPISYIQTFAYALINADDEAHRSFKSLSFFEPLTSEGRWRLYRVYALGEAEEQSESEVPVMQSPHTLGDAVPRN
jgi:hypothetical protein